MKNVKRVTDVAPENSNSSERRLGPAYWAASAILLIAGGLALYWRFTTDGITPRVLIALAVAGVAAVATYRIASDRDEEDDQ